MFIKTEKPKDSFIKLVEEIGEVGRANSTHDGRKEGDTEEVQAELGKELADVIHYTSCDCRRKRHFDLEKSSGKDLSAAIKYNHATNLVEFLQKTAKYD